MKLKYAGPRPIITHHGITFKDGKEDKYVYLSSAISILESMDEDYKNTGTYSHEIKQTTLSDDDMQGVITKYHPSLEDMMNDEIEAYDQHLKEEVQLAKKRATLNDVEREILVNNLNLMHDYRIQRAKNKIFYRHIVGTISDFIKDKKIKEIDTPFNEKFWHTLQTISGNIAVGRNSYYSDLELENKNGHLIAKLIINI